MALIIKNVEFQTHTYLKYKQVSKTLHSFFRLYTYLFILIIFMEVVSGAFSFYLLKNYVFVGQKTKEIACI